MGAARVPWPAVPSRLLFPDLHRSLMASPSCACPALWRSARADSLRSSAPAHCEGPAGAALAGRAASPASPAAQTGNRCRTELVCSDEVALFFAKFLSINLLDLLWVRPI